MAIVRVHKRENPFVQIDKTPINDQRLSWKAKGILVYLISKPNDWKVRVSDLMKQAKDGRDSVYAGLHELEKAGYISRYQERKEDGSFGELEYVVYEQPIHNEEDSPDTENPDADRNTDIIGFSPHTENPDTGKPHTVQPDTENPEHTNNKYTNNDFTNMDGWMGDSTESQSYQYEWDIFKGKCDLLELNNAETMDLYKIWRHFYSDCPISIAVATLQELMNDKIQLKDGGQWTEQKYKNLTGLYHHRMKQWKAMSHAYKDIDGLDT